MPFPLGVEKGAPTVQVGFHLCGHGPEIGRDAVDNRVRFQNFRVDGLHIILDRTDPRFVAFHTIQTPGDFFLDELDLFHLSPRVFGSRQSLIQQKIAVSPDSRTPENPQYFHFSLLFKFPYGLIKFPETPGSKLQHFPGLFSERLPAYYQMEGIKRRGRNARAGRR